jgi:hypothetical protein
MTEFKIGDEVEVLDTGDTCNLKGKIIDISQKGKQVRLSNDNNNICETWLAIKSLKLVEPQYPNPPLPHCEERIAFAKGANIEFEDRCGTHSKWMFTGDPKWHANIKYRVKLGKTKDDLRIEELERLIRINKKANIGYIEELADLNPTVHY